jgi:hypothetical protein
VLHDASRHRIAEAKQGISSPSQPRSGRAYASGLSPRPGIPAGRSGPHPRSSRSGGGLPPDRTPPEACAFASMGCPPSRPSQVTSRGRRDRAWSRGSSDAWHHHVSAACRRMLRCSLLGPGTFLATPLDALGASPDSNVHPPPPRCRGSPGCPDCVSLETRCVPLVPIPPTRRSAEDDRSLDIRRCRCCSRWFFTMPLPLPEGSDVWRVVSHPCGR